MSSTLLPSAHASRKAMSIDELVKRMRVVPDPDVPLVPTQRYHNAYFAFLAAFRRVVYAAVPEARRNQQLLIKEAARRWNRCDELIRMEWTLLADASQVPKDRRSSRVPTATHYGQLPLKRSRRWSPYSCTSRSATTSTPQMDFTHAFPAYDQLVGSASFLQDECGTGAPVAHVELAPGALEYSDLSPEHFVASASSNASTSTSFDDFNTASASTLLTPSPTAYQHVFPGSFDILPKQTALDTPSPPTPFTSHLALPAYDQHFDMSAFCSLDAGLDNSLWLDLASLQF